MYSCVQSGKTKVEMFEVKWDIYTLKISSFQELPNDENKAKGKLLQIGLNHVSNSGKRNGILKSSVMKNPDDFVLTDSKGSVFNHLDEIEYRTASISFDMLAGHFVEELSYFELQYDIPENIDIRDLSLRVNEQIIKLDKLLTDSKEGIKK
jgi:hypothetical protein